MQVNAGESQGEEAKGSTLKRRFVVADLSLARMVMQRNDPSRYGFQLEPDQVGNFHLSANQLHPLTCTDVKALTAKQALQRHHSCA